MINNLRSIPPVLKNLLLINIVVYIGTAVFENYLPVYEWFSAFYPDSPYFRVWQPVTYMFMHGGFTHLLFNMFALYSFGIVLEQVWGSKRFLQFYVYAGLGALLLQWGVQAFQLYLQTGGITIAPTQAIPNEWVELVRSIYVTPMVGASGAIFGVLVAFGMLFPNAELMLLFLPIPIKAKYIIPIYIVIELILGVGNFQWDNIAHYAHLGGALIGFILVKLWHKKSRNNFF